MSNELYSAPKDLPQFDIKWFEGESIPQSIQFMIDLLPTIRSLLKAWPREKILYVLDVGTSSGAGANLLGTLYRSKIFGVQMKVDALDISSNYKNYADHYFRDIRYIVGNIFEIENHLTWDIVLCSHTIEHIKKDDLRSFIKELQRRSRHWTIFYTPYQEQNLLPGHLTSFDMQTVNKLKPESVKIIKSVAWKHPVDKDSKCIIFVLKGTAEASTTTKEEEVKIAQVRRLIDEKSDYEAAKAHLEPLISKLPANADLNYLMGICIHRLNRDPENALKYYNLALKYGFDEFWVRYARGSLYYGLVNYEAAHEDLQQAILLKPSHEGPQKMLKLTKEKVNYST